MLRVDLQDRNTAFEVRLVHDDAAVQTAGTAERRVQDLRTVGRRQDEHALRGIEAVHFGKQGVQSLLALVVAAVAGIARLADCIDLIDENNAGRHLLGILEEGTDTGCTHADEHFHKVGTGQGEERDLRFAGNSLCKQGLAGAGRTDEQRALRQLRADLRVLARIVQEFHDLQQGFLRFVLSGYVREGHAGLLLHVHLRRALAEVAEQSAAFPHAPHRIQQEPDKHRVHEDAHPAAGRDDGPADRDLPLIDDLERCLLVHDGRRVYDLSAVCILHRRRDLVVVLVEGNFLHFLRLQNLQKLRVGEASGAVGQQRP